ncbi:MAG: membrane protein insertase YidC [Endomicrobium sp.]|jgi:YidC/Oxa1 family membrane protein insertase|nr:membrane protein insertase YidC [Endomicrobium sp.]
MQKNLILFIILSGITIFVWHFFIAPQQEKEIYHNHLENQSSVTQQLMVKNAQLNNSVFDNQHKEEHINIENEHYKAILTNKGAAILSWSIKEKNGHFVDLVLQDTSSYVMANFPDLIYKIISKSKNKIVFEYISKEGWKITKTYNLSNLYMHNLNITVEKPCEVNIPQIDIKWGPGIGSDIIETKENIAITRALAYTAKKPSKLKKLKNISEPASLYKWTAIDNRYFLVAFIPEKSMDFYKISSSKLDKKHPCFINISTAIPKGISKKQYSVNFYLGPKAYTYLKTYNLGLEKTVDFGIFGFLGKITFVILTFFYRLTHNYGWTIVIITIIVQILVLPLTLKSLKSAAAMKRIQPIIKDIQIKYKNSPQRLQVEMLNVYRSQKVNPLGGCLPMLLQLPIFWAFFTMLRNTYELRNEGWILWIKDLSMADHFIQIGTFNVNLLPLIMGIGMFLQQKMTAVTSDPMQKRMIYLMPVIFTIMFWGFPSGLVIYWITNSIVSMIEQYFIIKKDSIRVKHF